MDFREEYQKKIKHIYAVVGKVKDKCKKVCLNYVLLGLLILAVSP